uniref:Uncharacterized protein n=1 Tax=Globodera rostochiensis TaxID=31243 RepID=A0A914GZZ7_GLORO
MMTLNIFSGEWDKLLQRRSSPIMMSWAKIVLRIRKLNSLMKTDDGQLEGLLTSANKKEKGHSHICINIIHRSSRFARVNDV